MKSAISISLSIATLALAVVSTADERGDSIGDSVEFKTKIFTMSEVYKSMFGPEDNERLGLTGAKGERPEIVWITGIRAEMVGADGETPESPEYFCHSNFSMATSQPANRKLIFGDHFRQTRKLFTLVQGQAEIRFPTGYGLPVLSNDRFDSHVMVMNPTEREKPVRVGVESRLDFVRDSELEHSMRPLYKIPFVVKVRVDSPEGVPFQHEGKESCAEGNHPVETVTSVDRSSVNRRSSVSENASGAERSVHWYVPPGRHVYRHRLERIAQKIPYDTTIHYIASHLHPFGESLELIDLTTGESVYKATATNYSDRIAVEEITHYSSPDGLPIYSDHDYELVALYNNPLNHDIDSMAVMYLYLHDTSIRIARSKGGR